MSVTDISTELPSAADSAARPLLLVIHAVEQSLLVLVYLMTWSLPISSRLAINVFRVALILWLLLARDRRRERPASRIVLPWICFFAITAIASIASYDPSTSWQQMKVVELGFAAVLVADVVRSTRALKVLIAGLLVTATFAAIYGLWQSRGGVLSRAQGFYDHYVNFGEMLLLAALLSLGLVFASLQHARRGHRIAAALAFAALVMALASTGTRTFLAALLIGCGAMVWAQFRWRGRAVFAAVLVLAVVAGGWWLRSRRNVSWFDTNDPGTQYRFLIWNDGLRIIGEHPLLGVGFANVQRHPERFGMAAYRAFPDMISHFHSTPIEIAADCGIPALGIWIWLMVACWIAIKRSFDESRELGWFVNGTCLGVLGAVAAFQVASLFHYVPGDPEPMLLFWILIGTSAFIAHRPARPLA